MEERGLSGAKAPPIGAMSVDVENWFHILDDPAVPGLEQWEHLESRIEVGLNKLLEVFARHGVKATMFWLGWEAQRNKSLVRRCVEMGHEIASHGYAHVLPGHAGIRSFHQDAQRAKGLLEDISGRPVLGFRAAGFGATSKVSWAFDLIRQVGYEYDASVFPAPHGHGGNAGSPLEPYLIQTKSGDLLEMPMSVMSVRRWRVPLFGGGYLRLAPTWLIRAGIRSLHKAQRPVFAYVHPREVDMNHPHLPLRTVRRFKCYVNLRGLPGKLEWLCRDYRWRTMGEVARNLREEPAVKRCDRKLRPVEEVQV